MSRVLERAAAFRFPFSGGGEATHYCPGCGHGVFHKLIAEALDELGLAERTIIVSPVGCAVFLHRYFRCGHVQAAHGRAPVVATAVKRAHPDALVLCYQGDGDLAAIGTGNIIHAANRGENITVFFANNAVYGMTGGQMAPTTLLGQHTTTTPLGREAVGQGYPLRVGELLATLDAPAYVERVALGDLKHVARARAAVRKALRAQREGRGFSLVEALCACPSGWHQEPVEARRTVMEKLARAFPLGVFRDTTGTPLAAAVERTSYSPQRVAELLGEVCAGEAVSAPLVARDGSAGEPRSSASTEGTASSARILVAGFGGQGILSLGRVLARLGLRAGRHVSWLPSYGPEMRGGAAFCHVVLSERRVGSPLVSSADALIALSEPALLKFAGRVCAGGSILYDSDRMGPPPSRADVRVWGVPMSSIADALGDVRSANFVALGALGEAAGLFSRALVSEELGAEDGDANTVMRAAAARAGAMAVQQRLAPALPGRQEDEER